MLRIKLVRSLIGHNKRNKATVAALGLRKMHQTVDHKDTPNIRGMIHHVKELLHVVEISESEAKPNTYKLKPVQGSANRRPKKDRAKKVRVRATPLAKVRKPKDASAPRPKAAVKPKAEAKAAEKPKAAPKPKTAEKKAPAKKAPAKKKEAGK